MCLVCLFHLGLHTAARIVHRSLEAGAAQLRQEREGRGLGRLTERDDKGICLLLLLRDEALFLEG